MQGITAVIITKNEARNIGRCLDSLKGIADEILVLDSGSEDGTTRIAEENGAKVIQVEWEGYSITKNKGNALAGCNYVLSLDADEALSDELKDAILKAKPRLAGAYTFNRRANYCGKWIYGGGWYPDRKLRLFPKGKAQWKGDFVHETLEPDTGLNITHLRGDLLHYTYYNIKEHIDRAAKYAALAAKGIAASGKKNLGLKMLFSAWWKFVRMFFFKGGIRDGFYGMVIAAIAAIETFLKYAMAIDIRRSADKK